MRERRLTALVDFGYKSCADVLLEFFLAISRYGIARMHLHKV